MAIYTITVLGQCAGGEHIAINLKKDGAVVKRIVFTKTDLFNGGIDVEEGLLFLMRKAIKNAGATTLAQAKAAVEAMSIEL